MIPLFSRQTEDRTETYFHSYLRKSANRNEEGDCEGREMKAEIGMLRNAMFSLCRGTGRQQK
jgi:hypothetical protein